ncbi:MAG: hypothetical protein DRP60_06585 [Spirochaetes bacterium]|nr:MAG: hypothetical protein DRP60_06585 [Spirochaetota bacterium]
MNLNKPFFYCKYLQTEAFDIDWQVYLTSAGRQEVLPGSLYSIHKEIPSSEFSSAPWAEGQILDGYSLVYVTKGSGKFISDAQGLEGIGAGTMFLLFPGVRHWYTPDYFTGWHEYWICFNGNYPGLLVENKYFSPDKAVFNVGLSEEIVGKFHQVIESTRKDSDIFQPKLGASIIDLLALLLDKSRENRQNSKELDFVEKAKFLFEENIFNSIDMHAFAGNLGMEYARFRKIFKTYTGYSPYQYFLILKINKAKQLLIDRKYAIKEIAYQLSFENQYYFSRIFKSKTGYSPTNWLNRGEMSNDFISA